MVDVLLIHIHPTNNNNLAAVYQSISQLKILAQVSLVVENIPSKLLSSKVCNLSILHF
jgi:hypothetical protein